MQPVSVEEPCEFPFVVLSDVKLRQLCFISSVVWE